VHSLALEGIPLTLGFPTTTTTTTSSKRWTKDGCRKRGNQTNRCKLHRISPQLRLLTSGFIPGLEPIAVVLVAL
jgi:hypothetical protein